MIYSQTPLHNGLVRVSIKADGDGATLTFLDIQWSAVLSVPPSYRQSLHLFFFSYLHYSPSCTPTEMHTCKFSPLLILLFTFFNITHSSKIPSRYFVSSFNFGSVTAERTRNTVNSGDGALLELTSSVTETQRET